MLTGDALIAQVTEFIQSDLAKIGIQMKVHEIEFNQLLAMLNNPKADWQAAGLGETVTGYPTGEELFATNSFQKFWAVIPRSHDGPVDPRRVPTCRGWTGCLPMRIMQARNSR